MKLLNCLSVPGILLIGSLTLHGQLTPPPQFYNFLLTTDNVVGTPTPTGSAAYASVTLSDQTLEWTVFYETAENLSAAHFHGPADETQNAGAQVSLDPLGPSPLQGTATLSQTEVDDLIAGNYYLNLHTPTNSSGELRGQVINTLPIPPNVLLSGIQAGTNSSGAGAALVFYNPDTNQLSWTIAYQDLAGPVTGLHFHDADSIEVDVGAISGTDSGTNGSIILSDVQESSYLAGDWYLNIHNATYPSGEIRGQVVTAVPEPATLAFMTGLLVMAYTVSRRRRR